MDTTGILSMDTSDRCADTIGTFLTLLKQGVAQMAAIRGILEHEQAYAIAQLRRAKPQSVQQAKGGAEPWPPPNEEPLSHIG